VNCTALAVVWPLGFTCAPIARGPSCADASSQGAALADRRIGASDSDGSPARTPVTYHSIIENTMLVIEETVMQKKIL
jgi:hypothetical protein